MATASRSWLNNLWYEAVRIVLRMISAVYLPTRIVGLEHVPQVGAALLLANHQSHLDPPLIGMMIRRRVNFLARESLFTNRLFGAFLRSVGSIPIDRDGGGLSGLKESMRRLKQGELIVIFPEGTRTPDGEVAPFKPGFAALSGRTGAPIVPIGIDGPYQAFPRGAKLPRPGRIRIVVGRPISAEEVAALDDRAVVELVEQRVRACQAEARKLRTG